MYELDLTDQTPFPETDTHAEPPAQETVDIPEAAISEDAPTEDLGADAAEGLPAITAPESSDIDHEVGDTPTAIGHSALSPTADKQHDEPGEERIVIPIPGRRDSTNEGDREETTENLSASSGGDVPPTEPPTRELRGEDGEPEPRFVGSRPFEARQGIEVMSHELTTSLAQESGLETDVSSRLRADPSLSAVYEDLEISSDYAAEHPNVRFTPPRIDSGSLELTAGIPTAERMVDYAYTSGLADAVITSPEQAAAWLVRARDDLAGNVPPAALESLLDDIVRSYTSNLELHRLTRDPEGTAVRYTHTPYQDLPGYDGPEVDRAPSAYGHDDPMFRFVHPVLRPAAIHSNITSWFRNEPSPETLHGFGAGGERIRVTTTVRELEQTHNLALDRSLDASLLAFRNPRR